MRPPRYRFPDEVRNTTRAMASRMVEEGSVVATDDELEGWIAERPEYREPLERGGYGEKFGADDLLPLLHVFVGAAGGAPPRPAGEAPANASRGRWITVAVVVAALAILLLLLLSNGALGT